MIVDANRFQSLSREEAITILCSLEGPLLELILSENSGDVTASDVPGEVIRALENSRLFQQFVRTDSILAAWERFKAEHGEGARAIGEFVYGPDGNPWSL